MWAIVLNKIKKTTLCDAYFLNTVFLRPMLPLQIIWKLSVHWIKSLVKDMSLSLDLFLVCKGAKMVVG